MFNNSGEIYNPSANLFQSCKLYSLYRKIVEELLKTYEYWVSIKCIVTRTTGRHTLLALNRSTNAVNRDQVCGNTQVERRVKLVHRVSACTEYVIP
jgi:hypothetical protein